MDEILLCLCAGQTELHITASLTPLCAAAANGSHDKGVLRWFLGGLVQGLYLGWGDG